MSINPEFSHEEESLNPILWSVEQTDFSNGDVVMEFSVEGEANSPSYASGARLTLQECLMELQARDKINITRERFEDTLLVFSELVGNAIIHSYRIADILVTYDAERSELHLVVINPTTDMDFPAPDIRGSLPDDEHGRGMYITEALTGGNVSQDVTDDGEWFVAHAILDGIPTGSVTS